MPSTSTSREGSRESGVSKTRTLPVPQARLSSLDPISPHPAICIQLYFEEETEELNGSLFCQEEAIFFSSLPYLQPHPNIPNLFKKFTEIQLALAKKKKKKKGGRANKRGLSYRGRPALHSGTNCLQGSHQTVTTSP